MALGLAETDRQIRQAGRQVEEREAAILSAEAHSESWISGCEEQSEGHKGRHSPTGKSG